MPGLDCGSKKAKFCRTRVVPPSRCKPGTFRTIKLGGKGVKGVVCRLKGSTKTKLQTKLYPKGHPKCRRCPRSVR